MYMREIWFSFVSIFSAQQPNISFISLYLPQKICDLLCQTCLLSLFYWPLKGALGSFEDVEHTMSEVFILITE